MGVSASRTHKLKHNSTSCFLYFSLQPRLYTASYVLVCDLFVYALEEPHAKISSSSLGSDQGEAVDLQNLIDRLEQGRCSTAAIAVTSRRDAVSLRARVERAARVARLSTDVGLSEAGDGALGVVYLLECQTDIITNRSNCKRKRLGLK